jgi:integrase
MAFLIKQRASPYWHLRTRQADGSWKSKSTGLRIKNDLETRKAKMLCGRSQVEEFSENKSNHNNPAFAVWVSTYINYHYANKSQATAKRMHAAWFALTRFLNANDVTCPRQVKFHHGEEYLKWRPKQKMHGRKSGHNTALLEIKFLSQLMNEAIRREFTEANPLLRLGVGRAPQKVKPELTDADIGKIRAHFKTLITEDPNSAPRDSKNIPHPKSAGRWMSTAFEISLYTGCRFNETEIARENIDLASGTIRMCDSKRKADDPRKFFTVPIHDRLRPTLEAFIESGEPVTCRLTADKNGRINAAIRASGVNASFHSLRVTFVTRCHRGGLTAIEAMRLVNHSSQLIHKIYSRLNVDDVRLAQAKVQLP